MRSTRLFPGAALAALVALAVAGGCASDGPYSVSDEGIPLPATVFEAFRLAASEAATWSENAQVTSVGGGFTVLDGDGRGRNHTFAFHARDGQIRRRLDMHLFGGIPYQIDTRIQAPPPPLSIPDYVDTDVAVPAAINVALEINAMFPDSIPVPESFAARLSSRPAWPEPISIDQPADSVAWRVDFLLMQVFPASGAEVWWSTARFYLDPRTGQLYGTVVPDQPELYPFPSF
jgi:hypothetical protein